MYCMCAYNEEHLGTNTHIIFFFSSPPLPLKDWPLNELDLMNSVGDLCRFTMHEVFNRRGEFFDHDDILAKDEKHLPLIEWEYHHV